MLCHFSNSVSYIHYIFWFSFFPVQYLLSLSTAQHSFDRHICMSEVRKLTRFFFLLSILLLGKIVCFLRPASSVFVFIASKIVISIWFVRKNSNAKVMQKFFCFLFHFCYFS